MADSATAGTVYVKAARLLDVESGKYIADPLLKVTDGKVEEVSSGARAPDGADLVAVSGDPLADVTVLEHPAKVLKGGAAVE